MLLYFVFRSEMGINYWLFAIDIIFTVIIIFMAAKFPRMKGEKLLIFSLIIPGIGQSNMGYLRWGMLLNMFLIIPLYLIRISQLLAIILVIAVTIISLIDCLIKIKGTNVNMVLAWSLLPLNISLPGIGPAYLGNYIFALISLVLSVIPSYYILNLSYHYLINGSGEAFAWGMFLFVLINGGVGLLYFPLLIYRHIKQ